MTTLAAQNRENLKYSLRQARTVLAVKTGILNQVIAAIQVMTAHSFINTNKN